MARDEVYALKQVAGSMAIFRLYGFARLGDTFTVNDYEVMAAEPACRWDARDALPRLAPEPNAATGCHFCTDGLPACADLIVGKII